MEDSDRVRYMRVPDGLALDRDKGAIADMESVFKDGGYDIVVADPLYKLSDGDPSDNRAAINLMRRFDGWRERFGFALVLPMHCRKPHPNSSLSAHDLFGASAYQWGAEVVCGIERKAGVENFVLLHWWKDREGELDVSIDERWRLMFDRATGYHRIPDAPKPPAFDAAKFAYGLIRDSADGITRDDLKSALWGDRRTYTMGQIDAILAKLTGTGVTHNGERLKKDRVYRLPEAMFGADDAVTDPESVRVGGA